MLVSTPSAFVRPTRRLLVASVSLLALSASAASTAWAEAAETEDAQNLGIEEITVTAAKRGAQALQNVPISIQAIGADQLEARQVRDFADWAISVPSLRFEDLGPGDKRYIIRGIDGIGASVVGVYWDEAVITASNKEDGGGRNADIKLIDIERIEVLKGPQGTLYGASSMAGTIKIIPKKPDMDNFDAFVDGTYGTTAHGGDNWELNGMINLPLAEGKLAIRAVGWTVNNGGFIDNVRLNMNNINDEQTDGGRVIVRFLPTDSLTITASALIQRTDVGGTSRETPAGTIGHVPTPAFPPIFGGDLKTVSFTQDIWGDDIDIYSLTAEWDVGIGSFLATTNWYNRDLNFNFDSTPILIFFGAPVPAITHQPQSRRIWSNEIRFSSDLDGPLQFVVGGFLQREKTNFEVQVIASDINTGLPLSDWDPENDFFTGTGTAIFGRTNDGTIHQEALFGETSYAIMEDLTATVGVRYFRSRQTSQEQETHPFFGFGPGDRPPILPNNARNNKTTLKFNLAYQVTPDALLFATAAQGFRVGGVNSAGIPLIAKIPRSFSPDTLWNYEIGAKTSWFDRRLIVNASGFWIDWKNIQTISKDPTGAFQFIANASAATIKGLELEVIAQPTAGLDINLGAAYTDAKLTADQPGVVPGVDPVEVTFPGLKGDRMPNVPKWTLAASAQYTWPVSSDWNGVLRIDYSYTGKSKTEFRPNTSIDPVNGNPFTQTIGNYSLVNLRASIEGERWRVSIFANNLFDVLGRVDAIASDQDPLAFLRNRPRTVGINTNLKF